MLNFIASDKTLSAYTENSLTAACIETWGEQLEALNWNEKLWLLRDIISALGNPNKPLSDAACEAAEEITGIEINEKVAMLRALCDLMDDSVCDPLVAYIDNDWAIEAGIVWGDRLGDLRLNDHAWITYSLISSLVDGRNLPRKEELEECSAWLENGGLNDCQELIWVARALGEIILEQYCS